MRHPVTLNDGFDRTVSRWLDEEAGPATPDYLDEILVRTTRTRQRPAWSSLERWLPVQATMRLIPVPRIGLVLLIILALVAALGIGLIAVGSRPHLPPPFGLARNGDIVYGANGDIHALDAQTGASRVIVGGSANDETPDFSRDGSRFVFARESETPGFASLMVADADGSDVRALTEPFRPEWNVWSPDGSKLAVVDTSRRLPPLSIISLDGSPALPLDVEMAVERVTWRPDGRELVFLGRAIAPTAGLIYGLYAVGADGTGLRSLLPTTTADTDWMDMTLSPDGKEIVYTKWVVDRPELHVVNVDSGADRVLSFDGAGELVQDGWATDWSPDGTKLVFTRLRLDGNHLAVGSMNGGPVVETGPAFEDFTNGASATFSPDGTRLMAWYGFDESTRILDVNGGEGEILANDVDLASWQRLAR
jgi:WD40 repeat protein